MLELINRHRPGGQPHSAPGVASGQVAPAAATCPRSAWSGLGAVIVQARRGEDPVQPFECDPLKSFTLLEVDEVSPGRELPSGTSTMTVRTPHVALLDLRPDDAPRATPLDEQRHLRCLRRTIPVVEVKASDVRLKSASQGTRPTAAGAVVGTRRSVVARWPCASPCFSRTKPGSTHDIGAATRPWPHGAR